jgi:hypothetical protein
MSAAFLKKSDQRDDLGAIFLSPSLSGPTHLLRWVVQTDVAFYFMPGAQQQA